MRGTMQQLTYTILLCILSWTTLAQKQFSEVIQDSKKNSEIRIIGNELSVLYNWLPGCQVCNLSIALLNEQAKNLPETPFYVLVDQSYGHFELGLLDGWYMNTIKVNKDLIHELGLNYEPGIIIYNKSIIRRFSVLELIGESEIISLNTKFEKELSAGH